jgi:hypothetical protein
MTNLMNGLGVATLLLGIAGCSPTTAPVTPTPTESVVTPTATAAPESAVIPKSCDIPEMLALIDSIGFTGAVDVTPPWEPADGTDLKLAIDGGGIACAWGPPNTDAGVVVYWVPVTDSLWAVATGLWVSDGLDPIDVPDMAEDAAYFTYLPQSETNEFARWELNVLFDDLWIQVGTSSWVDSSDGNAVIETALDAALP